MEAMPAEAADVFGDRLPLAVRYAELLCSDAVDRGLVGPREPARVWTRHVLNSAALAPLVPRGAAVVDLGSGAGLPGIPLLLARPDLGMTLLEPLLRRVVFLEATRDALGLDVVVARGRAQDAPRGQADVVVARAVAPLDKLLGLGLPLLRPGGLFLAQKGAGVEAEVAVALAAAGRLGVTEMSVQVLGTGDAATSVVCVVTDAERLPLGPTPRGGRRVR